MRKHLYAILLTIVTLFSVFSINSCAEMSKINDNTLTITYTVTGYHHEPAGYRRSAHRYVFLHNDKYGDFTFDVSPRTYYDVTQGKKTLAFTNNIRGLVYNADNKLTKENILSHKEDFNIHSSFYLNNEYLLLISMIIFYVIFPIIIGLCYDEDIIDSKYQSICFHSTVVMYILSLSTSLYVTFA